MARYWYAYNGVDDPFDASNYAKLNPPTKPACRSGARICAIYAAGSAMNDTPNTPFSTNIQQYIARALTSSHVPQPNLPGAKYYVYLTD